MTKLPEQEPNLATDVTRSLPMIIADALRAKIVAGEYEPGARITQDSVAQELGVSRIPVREALAHLHKEGLVTLTANVGARVIVLDPSELDEIYRIREGVEPLAVRESIGKISPEDFALLDSYLEEMESVASVETNARWVELDRLFHHAIFRNAGMPRLSDIIEGLWNAGQPYRRAYTRLPERFTRADVEHRLILDALRRDDAEGAELFVRLHIRRTRLVLGADLSESD